MAFGSIFIKRVGGVFFVFSEKAPVLPGLFLPLVVLYPGMVLLLICRKSTE